MVSSFQVELRSESSQVDCHANTAKYDSICCVCSNHPLATNLINNAVSSDPELRRSIRPYSRDCKLLNDGRLEILILDTCSVLNWAECFQDWQSKGGTIICLVPSDPHNKDLELQMLHLGAAGILTFTDNLPEQLTRAIHVVATGRVWIRREIMDAYVNRTRSALRDLSVCDQRLTSREKQILDLLQRDLSNRIIAQRLAISERTTKFHVSNILRKLNLTSRRELRSLDSSGAVSPFRNPRLSVVSKTIFVSDFKPAFDSA